MGSVWPQLVLVGVLVLANAAFAGSEMALVSLRESQLQRLEHLSPNGARLARLAREPNRFLATIQIGITLAGFLASATAAVTLARPLEQPLSFLGRASGPAAVVAVTVVLAYVTLVLGELAPKRVAMQAAERWGLVAARPLSAVSAMARPVVWLLSVSTDAVVRLVGADPTQHREEVTEEEIRDLVAAQQTFTPEQRLIIAGAFELTERTLREMLRPRREVFVLDAAQPATAALHALVASGHSRAPVAEDGELDRSLGLVHVRDLLDQGDNPVGPLASPLCVFPETVDVLDALHTMQGRRVQLALVVDEHGGAAGIVTVEDLLEEIVGEIYDETDRDVVAVQRSEDGWIHLPGGFPIHDLEDIEVFDVPPGPYATVAGLVLDELGRLPETPGDRVEIARRTYEVTALEGRAITGIRISPALPDEEAESATAEPDSAEPL